MHLIVTGATGLVGSAVLHTMLTTPAITKISILSRRPVAQAEGHEKARVIIHKDFSSYDSSLMAELKDAKGVVWAQGISAIGMSKEEYEKITYTYPMEFAKALSSTSSPKPVNFIYVSGEHATTTPGLLTQHWARIKGLTEASLVSLSRTPEYENLRPISIRPGGVDSSAHKEIASYVPSMGRLKTSAASVLRFAVPSIMTPTREMGKVMVELAMGDGGPVSVAGRLVEGEGRTVRNADIREISGLDK